MRAKVILTGKTSMHLGVDVWSRDPRQQAMSVVDELQRLSQLDPDWNWSGTSQTPEVIMYNSKKVSADEAPKDWDIAREEIDVHSIQPSNDDLDEGDE